MDIGPALADARTKAGMTIDDVSQRTRIRGKIITEIEHDDYSSCGGDFYTRGHIRAIAKAVGADPAPLIEEYDGRNQEAELPLIPDAEPATKPQVTWPDPPDGTRRAPWSRPGRGPELRRGPEAERHPHAERGLGNGGSLDAERGPDAGTGTDEASVGETTDEIFAPPFSDRFGLSGGATSGRSAMGRIRPPDPDWRWSSAGDRLRQSAGTARRAGAKAYRRSVPRARTAGLDAYRRSAPVARQASAGAWRRATEAYQRGVPAARRAGSAMSEQALPWLRGVAGEARDRVARLRPDQRRNLLFGGLVIGLALIVVVIYLAVSGSSAAPGHVASGGHRATGQSGRPAPSTSAPPPSSPPAASPSPAAAALQPVSARAFGPGGPGDGDNPQYASLVLGGGRGGWHSNWYASAEFGNLQSGTGLLLDMGRPVTVTQARLALARSSGGSVELRAGNEPALSALQPVAQSATGPGTLTLTPGHPLRARYLLIWFSRLPPDHAGTYQVTVYRIAITGH